MFIVRSTKIVDHKRAAQCENLVTSRPAGEVSPIITDEKNCGSILRPAV